MIHTTHIPLACTTLFASALAAQPHHLSSTARNFLDEGIVNGVIAVQLGDQRPIIEAGGLADHRFNIPITTDTRFRIGSITKLMTSCIIERLIGQGVLSRDETVLKWIPELEDRISPDATIDHLLNHTSGIDGTKNHPFDQPQPRFNADDPIAASILQLVTGQVFDPGTNQAYSSTGTDLLGVIIERATDQTFAEALRSEITAPLGMTQTSLASNAELQPNLARSWHTVLGQPKPPQPMPWLYYAAGGVVSDADDMLRFANGLVDGDVLGTPIWELIEGESGLIAGMPFGTIEVAGEQVRYASMHGSTPGQTARLWLVEEPPLIVITLDNSESRAVYQQGVGLAMIESALTNEPTATGPWGTAHAVLSYLDTHSVVATAEYYQALIDEGRDPINDSQLTFEATILDLIGYPTAASKARAFSTQVSE